MRYGKSARTRLDGCTQEAVIGANCLMMRLGSTVNSIGSATDGASAPDESRLIAVAVPWKTPSWSPVAENGIENGPKKGQVTRLPSAHSGQNRKSTLLGAPPPLG